MTLVRIIRHENVEMAYYYMHDLGPEIDRSSRDVIIGCVKEKEAQNLIRADIGQIKREIPISVMEELCVQEEETSLKIWRGGMQWDETTRYTYSIEPAIESV